MNWPNEILALETRSLEPDPEPTLGAALALALEDWNAGQRDQDFRLYLLFLAWYCNLEPPHLTGWAASAEIGESDLCEICASVVETLASSLLDDPEVIYVVGLIAGLTRWLLGGDMHAWERRSEALRTRYRSLRPEGLPPSYFEALTATTSRCIVRAEEVSSLRCTLSNPAFGAIVDPHRIMR